MSQHGFDLIRSLEIFAMTAQTGSMSGAARVLSLSQSAVSQQIKHLEQSIGATLFDRTLRPMKLTPAGNALNLRASELVASAQEALGVARKIAGAPLPSLRLAVLSSLATLLVPALVFGLREQLKIERLSVSTGLAPVHHQALLNRDTDIIISSSALSEVDQLESFALLEEPLIAVVPTGSVTTVPRDLGELHALMNDRSHLPFVRYSSHSPAGRLIETYLRRRGVVPTNTLEFDRSDLLMATVAAGRGWAISLPTHLLDGAQFAANLTVLPLENASTRTTHLVARQLELGSIPSNMARLSRQLLRDELAPRLTKLMPGLESGIRVEDD